MKEIHSRIFCCTLLFDSVRCRLFFGSDAAAAAVASSSADANFDGDNEIEDTVRLIRFLLPESVVVVGGGDDESEEEFVVVTTDSCVLFVEVGVSLVTVVD